jgi:hypothetical protein
MYWLKFLRKNSHTLFRDNWKIPLLKDLLKPAHRLPKAEVAQFRRSCGNWLLSSTVSEAKQYEKKQV